MCKQLLTEQTEVCLQQERKALRLCCLWDFSSEKQEGKVAQCTELVVGSCSRSEGKARNVKNLFKAKNSIYSI